MAGAATRKQLRPLKPIETSTPQQTPEPTTDTAVLARQASVAPPGHTASDTPGHGGTPSHMALQANPGDLTGPVDVARQATEYKSDPNSAVW